MQWFDIDRHGLSKLLERRGVAWVLYELLQNSWDEDGVTAVAATITREPGTRFAVLTVEDDSPTGFRRLSDAWTLFAESYKKTDAAKRGRWNLGEKLVLALCESASIETTTGAVSFDHSGRHEKRATRERGSKFTGSVRLTNAQVQEIIDGARRLIVPSNVHVTLNGEELPHRAAKTVMERITLPTEVADDDGVMRRSARMTTVATYAPLADEEPTLYEMGIPVQPLEGGDPWHIDIGQKVPLSFERDSVPPAFLKAVRVAVLNTHHAEIKGVGAATAAWVTEASSDPRAVAPAVKAVIVEKFEHKAVAANDLSDPEGTKKFIAQGGVIAWGGALTAGQWENVRRHNVFKPAGHYTPGDSERIFSRDGAEPRRIEPTIRMRLIAGHAAALALELLDVDLTVIFVREPMVPFAAAYGKDIERTRRLTFNVGRLGYKWFDEGPKFSLRAVHDLLIHEFAHEYSSDHLESAFHEACCDVGARLAQLALWKPSLFGGLAASVGCEAKPTLRRMSLCKGAGSSTP